MNTINGIISEFQKEKDNYHPVEAIKILIQGLNHFPDNVDLLHYLFDYMKNDTIMKKFGRNFIFDIMELQKKAPKKSGIELCLLEADLRSIHQDPQVTWETLAKGLQADPENEQILKRIEALNADPSEAPIFADELETIAKKVADGNFPKETFEYLLLIC